MRRPTSPRRSVRDLKHHQYIHEWSNPRGETQWRSARLLERSGSNRLTYLSRRKLERLETRLRTTLAAGTEGDIAEFGVALGGSAIVLAGRAILGGRRFHGFDVFAMIPPPTSEKDSPKSKKSFEEIASGTSTGISEDHITGIRIIYTERPVKHLTILVFCRWSKYQTPQGNI